MATRNPRKLTSWGNGCLSQYFLGGFIHLDNLMINALTWMFQPFWVGSSRTKLPFGVTTNDGKGREKNCPESCMTGSAVSSSHDSLASLAFIFIHQNFVHIFGAALNSTCCSNIVCIMSLKIQHDSTNIHHNFPLKVWTSQKLRWNPETWIVGRRLSFPFGMAQPGRCYVMLVSGRCISPSAIPGIPNAPHKLGKRNVHHSFHAKTSRANAPEGRLETSWVSSTFSEVLLPYVVTWLLCPNNASLKCFQRVSGQMF